jgi:hypothetical protein
MPSLIIRPPSASAATGVNRTVAVKSAAELPGSLKRETIWMAQPHYDKPRLPNSLSWRTTPNFRLE